MQALANGRSKLKKHLWRVVLARLSVANAKAACDYVLKQVSNMDRGTRHVLITGIIITYARPFGDNNGVGCLPKKFSKFDDPHLQTTHEMILFSRKKLFAHSDALADYADRSGRKNQLLALTIVANFGNDGMAAVRSQLTEPVLSPSVLPEIVALCEAVLRRLKTEEETLIANLFTDRPLREGENQVNIFDET